MPFFKRVLQLHTRTYAHDFILSHMRSRDPYSQSSSHLCQLKSHRHDQNNMHTHPPDQLIWLYQKKKDILLNFLMSLSPLHSNHLSSTCIWTFNKTERELQFSFVIRSSFWSPPWIMWYFVWKKNIAGSIFILSLLYTAFASAKMVRSCQVFQLGYGVK